MRFWLAGRVRTSLLVERGLRVGMVFMHAAFDFSVLVFWWRKVIELQYLVF
jgi:hypothetical protein